MASENSAGIVSNVGCDVNNTIQQTAQSARKETRCTTLFETTRYTVVERTADCANTPAHNLLRTPTGIPAASPSDANTEGHALRKNSGPACSFGNVEEQVIREADNETQQPSFQRRTMSHQRTDPDSIASLPGKPDGNIVLCHLLRYKILYDIKWNLS